MRAQIVAPFGFYASKTAIFTPNIGLASFSTACGTACMPGTSNRIVFSICDFNGKQLLIGRGRTVSFCGDRNKGGRSCTLRIRTKGGCSVRLRFRCLRDSTRLGFSVNFGGGISVTRSIGTIQGTSIIIFIKNVSPDLRNRRVKISLPNFGGKSHADVRLPRMRQGLLTTLRHTKGGMVLIGYSNSPIKLIPRARAYRTVLRT